MTEDELLSRYGLRPDAAAVIEIRVLLARFTEAGPATDSAVGRLLCVQLFGNGALVDVLPIWRAKRSSFDASCSIDVQLLCGAGLVTTEAYLAASDAADAPTASAYLRDCVAAGDFDGFTPDDRFADYTRYYGV